MTEHEKARQMGGVLPPVDRFMALEPDFLNRPMLPSAGPPVPSMGMIVTSPCVVSIDGALAQRATAGFFGAWDGYDAILSRFEAALASDSPGVVLRINSPGGTCAGCFEAVRQMQAMKAVSGKPVVAYVDEMAYSAAYALACVADAIVVPPSGGVGSVGVIAALVDVTKALETAGYRVAVVASGSRKTDTHPAVPITDAAVARLREDVNTLAEEFFGVVAESRGLTVDQVKGYQAGTFLGASGVGVKLADRVGSFADAVGEVERMAADRRAAAMHAHGRGMTTANEGNMTDKTEAPKANPEGEDAPIPVTISVEDHTKALADKDAAIAGLTAAVDASSKRCEALTTEVAGLTEKIAGYESARIEAKVDALSGKKFPPAAREQFLALAKGSEAQFDALMSAMPDMPQLGPQIIPEKGGEVRDNSDGDRNAERLNKLAEDRMAKTGEDKSTALKAVMRANPELCSA